MSIASREGFDALLARVRERARGDPEVQLEERELQGSLSIFRVRYRLPLTIEVMCLDET